MKTNPPHLPEFIPFNRSFRYIVCIAVLVLASPVSNAQFTGARIQLETFYPTFTSQTSTRPIATVSETEVEFPDVAQYEASSPGGSRLVNTDIDFSGKSIIISFRGNTSYSSFANATVNTYVFTDVDNVIPPFTNFTIDEVVTTLGIQPAAVTFTENQLFINVRGLSFNNTTLAKFDIETGVTEPPVIDTPPTLTLLRSRYLPKSRIFSVRGTASDENSIQRVEYRIGKTGKFRRAIGTTDWSAQVKLNNTKGPVILYFRAIDSSGNISNLVKSRVKF